MTKANKVREELVREIIADLYRLNEGGYKADDIADFILARDKKIVEPLVRLMPIGRIENNALFHAIYQTLTNAGVEV